MLTLCPVLPPVCVFASSTGTDCPNLRIIISTLLSQRGPSALVSLHKKIILSLFRLEAAMTVSALIQPLSYAGYEELQQARRLRAGSRFSLASAATPFASAPAQLAVGIPSPTGSMHSRSVPAASFVRSGFFLASSICM